MKLLIITIFMLILTGCSDYYIFGDFTEKPINTTIEEIGNNTLVTNNYANSTQELLIESINDSFTKLTKNHSINGVETTCIRDTGNMVVIEDC